MYILLYFMNVGVSAANWWKWVWRG